MVDTFFGYKTSMNLALRMDRIPDDYCVITNNILDDIKIVNISRLLFLYDLLNLDNKILHEASSIEDYGPFILFYGKFK